MLAHPLVGFHDTVPSNANGIGDHFRALEEAGLPIIITSAGSYGPVREAQLITTHPKSICGWRSKSDKWGKDIDVPHTDGDNYIEEYDSYQARVLSVLPKDWLPDSILYVMNEVGRNKADGCARYALNIAPNLKEMGIRSMWFGWSAGTPESHHWESPDMLAFLRLCEAEPYWYGIAIHEYSYTVNSLIDSVPHPYPWQTGRWRVLRDICIKHDIDFNKLMLCRKEFGWERGQGSHQAVPQPDEAIRQLDAFMRLDKSPHIPSTIWYLGLGEFGEIGNQTQKLIAPVTNWTLNNKYEADVMEAPSHPPVGNPVTHPNKRPANIGTIDPDYGLYRFLEDFGIKNGTDFDEISEEWSGDGVTPNEYNYQDATYKNGQYGMARLLKPEFNRGSWGAVEWNIEPDPKA